MSASSNKIILSKRFFKTAACSVALAGLAFSTIQIPANAAPAQSPQQAQIQSHTSSKSLLESYTLTHTKNGAVLKGKLAKSQAYKPVTLRVTDAKNSSVTMRNTYFEYEYADRHGNFEINLRDYRTAPNLRFQIELGGGHSAWYKFGTVVDKGTLNKGAVKKGGASTAPAPKPTTPPATQPKPTTPPVEEPQPGTPPGTSDGKVNPSNGKGGALTDRKSVSYSDGKQSSKYHIYAKGIDNSKPVGVVFQFHGDGAYEFDNPNYKLPGLAKATNDKNMIFVSVKAPNANKIWYQNIEANGDYVANLVQDEVYGKYNIDKGNVWLNGYSGGAEFITYELLEEKSNLFTGGGAVMFGGGGAPTSLSRTPSDHLKQNFTMNWVVGSQDVEGATEPKDWSALKTAKAGEAFYKKQGMKTSIQVLPGVNHGGYNEAAKLTEFLSK